MLRIISLLLIATLMGVTSCDRPSTQKPVEVKFSFKKGFEGEIILKNVPKSRNPIKQTDGSLLIEIDPENLNEYDRTRFPERYLERVSFADLPTSSAGTTQPAENYYLYFASWDVQGNMTLDIRKTK